MRTRKKMLEELERAKETAAKIAECFVEKTPQMQYNHVTVEGRLLESLINISNDLNISVDQLVHIKLTAFINAYARGQSLGINDPMPYGQYRGLSVGEIIKVDTRYINWLVSNSDIFILDEEATQLLIERSNSA